MTNDNPQLDRLEARMAQGIPGDREPPLPVRKPSDKAAKLYKKLQKAIYGVK